MSTQTGEPTGGTGQTTTGQDPTTDPTANPTTGQPPGTDPQTAGPSGTTQQQLSPEAHAAELKRARDEAATSRQELKTLRDELKAIKDAQLTDAQRVQQERDELKSANTTLEQKLVAAKVEARAATKGIVDPEVAAGLVAGKVTLDENGNPANIDEVLDALIAEKPYLKSTEPAATPPPPGSQTSPANGNGGHATGGQLTLATLKSMTPQQIAQLDPREVDRVLAGG